MARASAVELSPAKRRQLPRKTLRPVRDIPLVVAVPTGSRLQNNGDQASKESDDPVDSTSIVQNTNSQNVVDTGIQDALDNFNALLSKSVRSTPVVDKATGVIGKIIGRLSFFSGVQTTEKPVAEINSKRKRPSTPDGPNKRPMVVQAVPVSQRPEARLPSTVIPSKLIRPKRTDSNHTLKVKVTSRRDPYDIDSIEDARPKQASGLSEGSRRESPAGRTSDNMATNRVRTDDKLSIIRSERGKPSLEDVLRDEAHDLTTTESSNHAMARPIVECKQITATELSKKAGPRRTTRSHTAQAATNTHKKASPSVNKSPQKRVTHGALFNTQGFHVAHGIPDDDEPTIVTQQNNDHDSPKRLSKQVSLRIGFILIPLTLTA